MAHIYTPDNPYIFANPIRFALFDNDGTLYTEPKGSKKFQLEMAINAVQGFIPSLSRDQVTELIDLSRKFYGGSLEIFPQEVDDIFPHRLRHAH
mgnify:CR=1 FL=1